ncbi:hypothetical protein I3843_07G077800 [Carya illinoinensis]|nr:hypothetical protein I3843_07G077800 [Carya illinoinensis]KAG7970322.1 hypothetical protein I3843_07G077800 [Carya illinoinensis]
MARLERRYSHAKEWHRKFFFVFGTGWEFAYGDVEHCEFLIFAVWGPILEDRNFTIILFDRDEACLYLVYALVEWNDSATWSDFLLTCANINRFLVLPNWPHVFWFPILGCSFTVLKAKEKVFDLFRLER